MVVRKKSNSASTRIWSITTHDILQWLCATVYSREVVHSVSCLAVIPSSLSKTSHSEQMIRDIRWPSSGAARHLFRILVTRKHRISRNRHRQHSAIISHPARRHSRGTVFASPFHLHSSPRQENIWHLLILLLAKAPTRADFGTKHSFALVVFQ